LIRKRTGAPSGGWPPRENPQQRQRQKRERGRMFMTAGRHYGINGCGCKSFVGNVDAAVAAGQTTLDSGEKRTKRGGKDAFRKKNPEAGGKGFPTAFMP